MFEIFIQPIADKSQLPKIVNKSVFIQFLTPKFKGEGPVMTMYVFAVTCMSMLTVSEWDVPIGFGAGIAGIHLLNSIL